MEGVGDIALDDVRVDSIDCNGGSSSVPSNITNIKSVIKPGIKLPKTYSQRKTGNDYFHAVLPMSMILDNNLSSQLVPHLAVQ